MTDARRPIHLVVLLGATAGIYAVSLAGVTALQSAADRALIDDGAPLDATTSSLSAGHDAFENDLARAARAYGDAAAGYDRLAPRLDELEISLDDSRRHGRKGKRRSEGAAGPGRAANRNPHGHDQGRHRRHTRRRARPAGEHGRSLRPHDRPGRR